MFLFAYCVAVCLLFAAGAAQAQETRLSSLNGRTENGISTAVSLAAPEAQASRAMESRDPRMRGRMTLEERRVLREEIGGADRKLYSGNWETRSATADLRHNK